jgi:hypothetical protein
LLEYGEDYNVRKEYKEENLKRDVVNGKLEWVKLLIEKGDECKEKIEDGRNKMNLE